MKLAYPLVLSVGFASYFGKVTGRIKLKSVVSDLFLSFFHFLVRILIVMIDLRFILQKVEPS